MANPSTSPNVSFDIIIIGSGPSGTNAALQCVRARLRTALIDIGNVDTQYQMLIPEKSFAEIRQTAPNQSLFFLGEDPEKVFANQARAGVHLTPARQHMIEGMDQLFPLISDNFFALQSTGFGGLGISWGANAFAFEEGELDAIGLPAKELRTYYGHVSEDIGISGSTRNMLAPLITQGLSVQPALPLDSNAEKILQTYEKNKDAFSKNHFYLGQSLMAILSQPLGERKPNPLFDMDFWSDHSKSVYRPRYTLEEIKSSPEHSRYFTHLSGRQALEFVEDERGVTVQVRHVKSNETERFHAKKLILAAGAINSARIVLQSFKDHEHKTPILCNHNLWIAALNLPMLGRATDERRYSLAQLTSLLKIEELSDSTLNDYMLAQFYSYRSLLLFRLLKDVPLPPALGIYFLRLVLTSFTCINIHFSDRPNSSRFLRLASNGALEANCSFSNDEERLFKKYERKFMRLLLKLKIIPLGTTKPMHGASIHYAGTLPFSEKPRRATCSKEGKLHETRNVYVADGSGWKFLPSKGLTVTLMANARRIAQNAIEEFKKNRA